MADLLMILVMVAFIVICVGYVAWCDRVIGPPDTMLDTASDAAVEG